MSQIADQALTLFSTTTNLAYSVAQRFMLNIITSGARQHRRWIAFPIGIYWSYHEDIAGDDGHSLIIER